LLFGTGIAISLYKAKEFDNDITLKDLNEYKRSR